MAKFRQHINSAFYIRYSYAYVIVNIETGLKMVYYKQQSGSPRINTFAAAERWLNDQESERLNIDIDRPNTKWVFVKFSNIDVKVVLDNQPMLGTGPLPDWLRNLVRGRVSKMVLLDTFDDILCLWCCIAVYQGARPDRSTQAVRELAKSFLKLSTTPNDVPRTSLDELDKVERHLNQGKQLSDWLGIRIYQPERQENGEILWHLRKNPSDKPKNIMTIRIYDEHAFLIKDMEKLARIYACVDCRTHFRKVCHLQQHAKTCAQGRTIIDCPNERVKVPQTSYERAFYHHKKAQTSASSIRWFERTSKLLRKHIHHALCGHGGERWLVVARPQRRCSNTTAATGMVVVGVFQMAEIKLSTTTKLEKIDFLQQWNTQEPSK